jgi:hypothetical protein
VRKKLPLTAAAVASSAAFLYTAGATYAIRHGVRAWNRGAYVNPFMASADPSKRG